MQFSRPRLNSILFALGAGFAGFATPDCCAAEAVVSAGSAHYTTVRDRVGDGGQVFVYVDVDGYFEELGRDLTTRLAAAAGEEPELARWKQDYAALASELGLDRVKAVGLSTRKLADGRFSNRMFLHVPAGRSGLLEMLGGGAHSFDSARIAPADTDLFVEAEADINALYGTVMKVLKRVDPQLAATIPGESGSKEDVPPALASVLELLHFKGRVTVAMRMNPKGPLTAEMRFAHDVVCRVDSFGPQILGLIQSRWPGLKVAATELGRTIYTFGDKAGEVSLPLAVAVEGQQITFATSEAFLRECLERKDSGLAGAPLFRGALEATASEGNTLVYATPRLFRGFVEVMDLLSALPFHDASTKAGQQYVAERLKAITSPVVSVSSNLPDGVLIRSVGPTSLRESLPFLGLATPDLAGNIVRVALPTMVEKQRANLQLERGRAAISENLKRFAEAATAYFEKNPEEEFATYDKLAAFEPALAQIRAVAGEEYALVSAERARDSVSLSTEKLGELTQARPLTKAEVAAVKTSLQRIAKAASVYLAEHGDVSEVAVAELVGEGKPIEELKPVVGEDYTALSVARGSRAVSITLPAGQEVEVDLP